MSDPRTLKAIQALVRDECLNMEDEHCLMINERCPLMEKDHAQIDDAMDLCEHFQQNILPVGWDLDDLISYAMWYDNGGNE